MPGDLYYQNVTLLLSGDGLHGSASFIDTSPSPKVGTPTGGVTNSSTQRKWGTASIYFDGTSGRLTYPHGTGAFSFGTGDFTIEFWVFPTATRAGNCTLLNCQTSFYSAGWKVDWYDRVYLSNTNNAVTCQGSVSALPLNQWSHMAFTRSGGTVRSFLNGVLQFNVTMSGALDAAGILDIGKSSWLSNYFPGYLDDLRITKGIARYTATFTPPAYPYLPGGGEVSGIIRDSSGAPCGRTVRAFNRSTGSLLASTTSDWDPNFSQVSLLATGDHKDSSQNGLLLTAVGTAALSAVRTKFESTSFIFNGNGSGVTAPSGPGFDFGTGDFTVEAWIFPTNGAATTSQGLVVRDSIGGTRGWLLYLGDGTGGSTLRGLAFGAWSGATVSGSLSTFVPTINAWTHVAVTRESGVFKLWADGALVASDNTNLLLSVGSPTTPLCIGSLWGTAAITANASLFGHIAGVRITKGLARYLLPFTPPSRRFEITGTPGFYSILSSIPDEINIVAYDDAAGSFENDQILRVIPA